MKRILECNNIEAKNYFLKEECYFNFDLPQYFEFQNLIDKISDKITGKNLFSFCSNTIYTKQGLEKQKVNRPCDYENVNYKFLNNKDGKFAWRPFQLIHPALYVSLVHKITEKENWELIIERFKKFETVSKIKCTSIPLISESKQSNKAITVSNWWQVIEQQSIELALDYEYVLHTDITDCYGSIYTHSIVWALHTKEVGKKERGNDHLLGTIIDKHLQHMAFGQTNGIPQGSVLMDFIAEMVLGYADLELHSQIKDANLRDYHIIRYRDDYRIFSNNPQDAELIMKHLTEILIGLGMRFNPQKTMVSHNVVRDSIKPDKLYWISNNKSTKSLQAHLLIIHELSLKYPNSGSLSKALTKFYKRIHKISETNQNIHVLVSIIVDIAFKNPRTYPIAAAILSKFLSLIDDTIIQEKMLKSIFTKFDKIPNTGNIQLWLQRVTIKIDRAKVYDETLCKKINDSKISLWNSEWLNEDFKKMISEETIINEETIEKIDKIIEIEEVELFGSKSSYDY